MRLKYYCKEAWGNSSRYGTSGFSAVLVIAMAISVLGVFVWVVSNLSHARNMLSKEIGILVFVKEGSRSEIPTLLEQIKKIPGVAEVKYITKEQALQEISDKPDIKQEIAILGFNPLPDTIEVKTQSAFSPGQLETIADQIHEFPSVDNVDYGQESLENVAKSLAVVEYFTFMVGTVITIATLVLAMITMKLTLYSRKNDMEILEVVGATPMFIRGPILVESILYGALGGLLAISFLYAVYNVTKLRIDLITFVNGYVILGLFVAGIFVSLLGAIIESYRQLRVK